MVEAIKELVYVVITQVTGVRVKTSISAACVMQEKSLNVPEILRESTKKFNKIVWLVTLNKQGITQWSELLMLIKSVPMARG